MTANLKQCCLCSQISGFAENDLISQMIGERDYVRRVPVESSEFAVVPSLGPLAPGHSLLCPKAHLKSFAQLALEAEPEFLAIKLRMTELLREMYGAPVHCFEHGSSRLSTRVLCTVEHAHLHLVPADIDVLKTLVESGSWVEIAPGLESLVAAVEDREFLYYQTPDLRCFVATREESGFESQYMRRIFATLLNRQGAWDWRTDPRVSDVDRAFSDLRVAAQH